MGAHLGPFFCSIFAQFMTKKEGVQFATLEGGVPPRVGPFFTFIYDISLENVLKLLKMVFAFHFKL